MSLEKKSVIDRIEILENGVIQVRRKDSIMEDGKEIGKSFHRHVLVPGVDVTGEDSRVKAVAKAVWTKTTVDKYIAMMESIKKGMIK